MGIMIICGHTCLKCGEVIEDYSPEKDQYHCWKHRGKKTKCNRQRVYKNVPSSITTKLWMNTDLSRYVVRRKEVDR